MRDFWLLLQLFCLMWTAPVSAQFFTPVGNPITGISTNFSTATTIAMDGDYLVVGMPEDDRPSIATGSVQAYHWEESQWVPLGEPLFGAQPNAQLGTAVAVSGRRMAVGAPYQDGTQDEVGEVCVYEWTGNRWKRLGEPIQGQQVRQRLGASIALDGDRLVVGSPHYDGVASNSGQVQTYVWNGRVWEVMGRPLDGVAAGDEFGRTVALEDQRLVVAAPYHAYNSATAGRVQVYDWNGSDWVPMGEPLQGMAPQARFGFAIALDGDRIVIGSPDPSGRRGAGQAVVYQWTGKTWKLLGAPIEGKGRGDGAGWAVALSGDRVAIGAPEYDGVGNLAGQVQLYEWRGVTWEPIGTPLQGTRAGQCLGYALDLTGNTLLVAIPGATQLNRQRGILQRYTFCQKAPKVYLQTQTNTLIAETDVPVHYQWRHCDRHKTAIPKATFDNYTPSINGHYALSVTEGECTHILDCATIKQVPKQLEVAPGEVRVYPNPTFGPITVMLGQIHRYTVLRLYNLAGKVLSERRYNDARELSFSLDELPAGVYLLMVQTEGVPPQWIKVHRD